MTVSKAYGGKGFATEAERIADLMKLYLKSWQKRSDKIKRADSVVRPYSTTSG